MKKKLVLKPFVVPTLYTIFAVVLIISLFLSIKTETITDDEYVNNSILDEYIPVIKTDDVIQKPFTSDKVEVYKKFYDYEKEEEDQQNSILYHENTYIQNTGISYKSDEVFEVNSILSGEVIEVKDTELLGKSITIRHDNELISVYQSLSNIVVKKGDKVATGEKIAESGKCNLLNSTDNNLHLEIYNNGNISNPENFYNKKLTEF